MGSITLTGGGGVTSYVGMIVHSTTLDTEAKVKEIYGGTTWIQHSGYFLRGASSGVVANSAAITGGDDNAYLIKHDHTYRTKYSMGSGNAGYDGDTLSGNTGAGSGYKEWVAIPQQSTDKTGSVSDGTNRNIPKYKSVYIWERTV